MEAKKTNIKKIERVALCESVRHNRMMGYEQNRAMRGFRKIDDGLSDTRNTRNTDEMYAECVRVGDEGMHAHPHAHRQAILELN